MTRVPVTLALSGYHHTSALQTGLVPVEGVDLNVLTLPVEEIFYRFTNYREWEVSEMSMGKYIALRSAGDVSLVGIPVFPSRVFRHSSIFVRRDGITDPRQLSGARVGVPEVGPDGGGLQPGPSRPRVRRRSGQCPMVPGGRAQIRAA